jgi:hypothetical protein
MKIMKRRRIPKQKQGDLQNDKETEKAYKATGVSDVLGNPVLCRICILVYQ